MSMMFQSHGGPSTPSAPRADARLELATVPAAGDVAPDARADFGYLLPPCAGEEEDVVDAARLLEELDRLGDLMIDADPDDTSIDATPDSSLPPVFTYWGQFLDHELTARTDREGEISSIENPRPGRPGELIEASLKNARTPRFDLDSVYGGLPLGTGLVAEEARLLSGLRHPELREKMRVGTAHDRGDLPDELDPHRDLPRYQQVEEEVREAALAVARERLPEDKLPQFEERLSGRAIIGDMRNDENLVVAQFHLSFLRFHNKAIDFLETHETGWIADYYAARSLTRLHYQWLIVEGYLRAICDETVLDRVLADGARGFFRFRADYDARNADARRLGNALPLEFSVAAYRFGHSMVRNTYDYNKNFGRGAAPTLPNAPFDELFRFTGGGDFRGDPRVPRNWVIDWRRFVGVDPHDDTDGQPARVARRIDTQLAPPLRDMLNEGKEHAPGSELHVLFRHLARRNLRRGLDLGIPSGQALHRHLRETLGVLETAPHEDVSVLMAQRPELATFLRESSTGLHERTPLWFYCLAEAEASGGNRLGELGSYLVASTFVGVLLADPDSALSSGFMPEHSPLRSPSGDPIDSLERWMEFALVMESASGEDG